MFSFLQCIYLWLFDGNEKNRVRGALAGALGGQVVLILRVRFVSASCVPFVGRFSVRRARAFLDDVCLSS